jgi:hypothetical protein
MTRRVAALLTPTPTISTDIGLDGLPTDPNHPFNRAR